MAIKIRGCNFICLLTGFNATNTIECCCRNADCSQIDDFIITLRGSAAIVSDFCLLFVGFWINIALFETLFQVMLQTCLDCIVDMDFALYFSNFLFMWQCKICVVCAYLFIIYYLYLFDFEFIIILRAGG